MSESSCSLFTMIWIHNFYKFTKNIPQEGSYTDLRTSLVSSRHQTPFSASSFSTILRYSSNPPSSALTVLSLATHSSLQIILISRSSWDTNTTPPCEVKYQILITLWIHQKYIPVCILYYKVTWTNMTYIKYMYM